jgi:hypothetical protein
LANWVTLTAGNGRPFAVMTDRVGLNHGKRFLTFSLVPMKTVLKRIEPISSLIFFAYSRERVLGRSYLDMISLYKNKKE